MLQHTLHSAPFTPGLQFGPQFELNTTNFDESNNNNKVRENSED